MHLILRLFVVNHHRRSAQVWHVFSRDFTVLQLHTHTFIRNRNEPYLSLPSQPQLVLIYRPRRNGRLSRPWCEVAQAENCDRTIHSLTVQACEMWEYSTYWTLSNSSCVTGPVGPIYSVHLLAVVTSIIQVRHSSWQQIAACGSYVQTRESRQLQETSMLIHSTE